MTKLRCALGSLLLLGFAFLPAAAAEEEVAWDLARVTSLATSLHEGVKSLRDEIRKTPRDIASTKAWAYYRLMDNLRLIEQETRHLQKALESGAGRDETLPVYARIVLLRRDCEEEMERQYLGSPALTKIVRARSIVKQMDPYYGVDPGRDDHERVLEHVP